MLSSKKRSLISAIKGGINGGKVTLAEDFSIDAAVTFAKQHQICGILLYGLLAAGIKSDDPRVKELFSCALTETVLHEQQLVAINAVYSAFEKAEVDYMPLKGSLLKELYPKPELRVMSDADILIKTEQYETVKKVLSGLSFTEAYESNHEIVWKKGSIVIELHKFLIPSYNTDYFHYFENAWEKAENIAPFRYRLNQNDEFIFTFTHFAKHYRDGGIGIKHFIDLWLLLEKYELNMEYIKDELKKIRLDIFFGNIEKALDIFFGEENLEDQTAELIIKNLIRSGVYGKKENRANASAIRSAGGHKVGSFWARISVLCRVLFPKAKNLAKRFPFLEKAPILLPLAWFIRFASLMFRPSRILKNIKKVKRSQSKQVLSMEQELKQVGLDFK
ncbi:MAG: hypothetical protein E7540_00220 [Ruminococcaceae bacterium]|nr:hypothetical protein [Oscillospiraceae bacterium]